MAGGEYFGMVSPPIIKKCRYGDKMARKLVERPQTIIGFKSSNVKRLCAVEISLEEGNPIVLIGGRNGQGKSSVLDSIMYALTGKNIPKSVLHDGADRAETCIETQDLFIKFVITKSSSRLEVRPRHIDMAIQKPRLALNNMIGKISFDPMEFNRLSGRKQGDELKKIVGVDFSDIDQILLDARDERTGVNRDLKRAQVVLGELPYFTDAGEEEASASELMEEYRGIQAQNSEIGRLEGEKRDREQGIGELDRDIERTLDEIEKLKERVVSLKHSRDELAEELSQISSILSDKELQDTSEIEARIAGVDDNNRKVRANAEYQKQQEIVEALNRESSTLNEKIGEIEKERQARIAAADMPVDGLAFSEDGELIFNGRPLEVCSQSEKLRVSVAIAMAGSPDLRIILVREGSALDSESLRTLGKCAAEYGASVWVEQVMEEPKEGVIFIEDGMVLNDKRVQSEHEKRSGIAATAGPLAKDGGEKDGKDANTGQSS
jgi:ABC-type dipeptide/oligopeptide/nickel transport system ATPase component